MGPRESSEPTAGDEQPTDERSVFSTYRRTFLRGTGAGALGSTVLLAGCSTAQTRRYEAEPVSLAPEAQQRGYVLANESTSEVIREKEVGGASLEVTLISHLASYDLEGADYVKSVTVGLASTPAAKEAGVALNPVANRPLQELLTQDIGREFLQQTNVSASWQRGPDEIGQYSGRLLDQQVQFQTFAGVTDDNEFVLLNAVRVTAGDDAVIVGDARTKAVETSNKSFVGENGYVTQATVDQSAQMFADLLPLVIHGEGGGSSPSPATTTKPTATTEFPKTAQGSVTRRHTEEVPDPPAEPPETELPPEGYPIPEEEFEELKEQAARGELPQPPEDELQRDPEPQQSLQDVGAGRSYSGATNLDKSRTQGGLSVDTEFAGWDSSELSVRPSDANLAVGNDKAILAVNLRWGIYDKNSGNRQYEATLKDWFAPVIDKDNTFVFDPKALYDHREDRYILMAVGRNKDERKGSWLVAVSDDGDPFGTWWLTRIPHSDEWVDYPGLGVDQNGIYLTANIFDFSDRFQYSRLVSIDKTPLYNGNSFTYWWYNQLKNPNGSRAFTIQPTHGMSTSENQYFVNSQLAPNGATTLTLWELRNPTSNPRLSSHEVNVSPYSVPPNADQPNTNNTLETVGARLMNAVYENGSVWTAHSISCDWQNNGSGDAMIKWYEIDVDDKSVVQTRGWGRPNGDYFFPTIASNAETSTVIVYNESGPNTDPQIEVAGRTKGHTENSLESVALIKGGESTYRLKRWGDYNGIVVDPTNLHYWTYSQYGHDSSNTIQFETWVGEVFF